MSHSARTQGHSALCDIRPMAMPSLGRMPSRRNPGEQIGLLQGTLDLLILKTLVFGPCHGQGMARSILRQSEEVFFVDHGSLYLALQRLEEREMDQRQMGRQRKQSQGTLQACPVSCRQDSPAGFRSSAIATLMESKLWEGHITVNITSGRAPHNLELSAGAQSASIRGRLFTEADDASRPGVAVINQTLAQKCLTSLRRCSEPN